MWHKLIGHRGNRTLLLTGLTVWLVVCLSAFLARRYLYNLLLGPFPLDQLSLASLSDAGCRWQYYVTIEPTSVKHLFPYAHSGGTEPYSVYALLSVGDKVLVARLPLHHDGRVSGTLEELSSFERKHILLPLGSDPVRGCNFQPFRFNGTRYFRTTGYLLSVIPLVSAAWLGTWLLLRGLRGTRTAPARA